jgi:hypothetical protein
VQENVRLEGPRKGVGWVEGGEEEKYRNIEVSSEISKYIEIYRNIEI